MKLNSTFLFYTAFFLLVFTEKMNGESVPANGADNIRYAGLMDKMDTVPTGESIGEGIRMYDFGNSLQFDGRNDYVLLDSSVNPRSNDWTVSYWLYPEIVSEQVHLGVDVIFTRFGFANATTYRMRIYSTNYDFVIPRINLEEWHHVLISRTGGKGRVFINGQESASGEIRIPLSGWEWNRFGVSATSGFLYKGRMDDIMMWIGKAADDALAQTLYNNGKGADPVAVNSTPTHGWKLDGTDSTRLVRDYFGQVAGSLIKFPKMGMWVEH